MALWHDIAEMAPLAGDLALGAVSIGLAGMGIVGLFVAWKNLTDPSARDEMLHAMDHPRRPFKMWVDKNNQLHVEGGVPLFHYDN